MPLVSSSATAPGGVKIRPPFELPATRPQVRQSWWRSLWFRRECKFAEIRDLMLGQLGAVADEGRRSALEDKIGAARHPEALWLLRQDLMQALVEVHGEMLARRRLTDITFMFAGLLDRHQHAIAGARDRDDPVDWPAGTAARGLVRNAVQLRTDH